MVRLSLWRKLRAPGNQCPAALLQNQAVNLSPQYCLYLVSMLERSSPQRLASGWPGCWSTQTRLSTTGQSCQQHLTAQALTQQDAPSTPAAAAPAIKRPPQPQQQQQQHQ